MSHSISPFEGYAPLLSSELNGDEVKNENFSIPHQGPHGRRPSRTICIAMAALTIGFSVGLLLNQTFGIWGAPQTSCQTLAVRHEWRSLSKKEKGAYLEAVQCLRTVPSRLGLNQTLYDDFPYLHTRTGEDGMSRLPDIMKVRAYLKDDDTQHITRQPF